MKYHILFDKIQKVLESCKTKQHLAIGEDYCLRLINKNFPYSLLRNRKRRELIDYVEDQSKWIRNFFM